MWIAAILWGCLAACNGEQRPLRMPSSPLATQAISPIVTSTTVPLPTETAVATARFTYQGVSFSYANGLVRRLTTKRLAAAHGISGLASDTAASYYFGVPDFLVFNFEDISTSPAPSRLVIQRLRDDEGRFYEGYPEAEIGRLTQLAAQQQTELADTPHTSPLDFENGTGFRSVGYLPVYSSTVPLSDTQLFYLFEGVTADGRYAIWLQFNLQTPILPDEPGQFSRTEREAFTEGTADYQTYLREQLTLVQTLPPSAFTPNLTLLDSLVQSLFVPLDASTSSSLPVNEVGCVNTAVYINDITIPTGTQVTSEQSFLKTWRIRNTGSCTWSAAYQLVSENDDLLPRVEEPIIPVVPPGETVDISISYHSPAIPGLYQEVWQLQAPLIPSQESSQELFGPILSIAIEVTATEP